MEENLNKNHSERAFQVVKDITKQRQLRVSSIQYKQGNCPMEVSDVIKG